MNSLLVLYGVTLLSRERLCKSISNTWTQFLNLWCNSCEEVALLKIQELLDFHKWNTKRLYFSIFPSDASWIWHSKSTEHFPVREHCQSLICPVTYTSISAWFDGCDLNHVQQTANIWTSVFLCDVLAMIRTLFTQLPLSPRSHFNTLHLLGRLLNSLIDAFLYFYLFVLSSLLWLVVTWYFYFKVRW